MGCSVGHPQEILNTVSVIQQSVLGVVFRSLQAQRRMEEQDPEGLVEELRVARRAASRGEKQLPGPAANILAGIRILLVVPSQTQLHVIILFDCS